MTRQCLSCKQEKPLEEFHKHRIGKEGRRSRCAACRFRAESSSRKIRERDTGLRVCRDCDVEAPIESFPAVAGGHRRLCHSCLSKRANARNRRWRKTPRGRELTAAAKTRHVRTDRYRLTYAAYRERRNEASRRYRRTEHGREAIAKFHAFRRGAMRGETISRRSVWERDDGKCKLCGRPVELKNMHLDHIVPIVRGGEHTYANVQTTHRVCNQSKGAKCLP